MDVAIQHSVGSGITGLDRIRYLPESYQTAGCRYVSVQLKSAQDVELVQTFLLSNAWPDLEALNLDYRPQWDVVSLRLPPHLPRLRELHLERLIVVPPIDLPRLATLYCCTELGPIIRPPKPPQEYLVSLLSASRTAKHLTFAGAFFPSLPPNFALSPPVSFPNLIELFVEDEWKYFSESQALGYIAAPPTSQLALFAHTNEYAFDLPNKGFWLDVLPRNFAHTLPMLAATRALRLLMGMYVPYPGPAGGHDIPFTNGMLLAGAPHPSGLSNGVMTPETPSTWFLAVTNSQDVGDESIPYTLREIPQIVDCSQLVHLEMHTQIYYSPDRARNEWQDDLLKYLVNLQYLEIGGRPTIERVLSAAADCEWILPRLSHLVLCYAALPGEILIIPQDVRRMLQQRLQWNRPVQRLTLRVPERPRGRLSGYKSLMPETNAMLARLQQSLRHLMTVEVVRSYCQSCHDGDTEEDYANAGKPEVVESWMMHPDGDD